MSARSRQLIAGLPSLESLGISAQELLAGPSSKVSDGVKTLDFRPISSKNIRPKPAEWPLKPKPTVKPEVVSSPKPKSSSGKTFPNLAIIPHGAAILQLLASNPIIAVDSPTGTGKTRYLPYLIAQEFQGGKKVRVAIPTTVAVRDAYNFLTNFTDIDVGYAAGREIKYAPSTHLVYGTTGHFTQKIINLCRPFEGQVDEELRSQIRQVLGDVFFVDEVHAATTDTTQLVGLINFIFRSESGGYIGPKLVFSTATFNSGDIMEFFPNFPIYKVELQAFPVETIFLESPFDPKKEDIDTKILPIIRNELAKWNQETVKYHMIIFRPGVNEVDTSVEFLEKAFGPEENIEFYPAYSRLTPAEIDQIFQVSSKMKVVIGTNIIESSITIQDVAVVINDMLVKTAETSLNGGSRLALSYTSQAESNQRKGRTGRTMPGRAYFLCNESFWRALPPFRTREIDRVPIYNVVLQLLDAGLSPRSILKVSNGRYTQALQTLSELGMIVWTGNGYRVTEAGKFVSGIPLSVQNSYMVYLGFQIFSQSPLDSLQQVFFRTILATASMLEVFEPGYFFIPRKSRDETESEFLARKDAHVEKYHEKFRGETDIHTLVNIFWEMLDFIRVSRTYDRSVKGNFYDYVKNFAIDNQMNNKKLREMMIVLRDVEEAALNLIPGSQVIDLHGVVPEGGYEQLGNRTAEIFGKAYINNLLVRNSDRQGKIVYIDPKSQVKYRIGSRSGFSRIVIGNREGPGRIIAAETLEVAGKNGVFNLASILVDEKYIPNQD